MIIYAHFSSLYFLLRLSSSLLSINSQLLELRRWSVYAASLEQRVREKRYFTPIISSFMCFSSYSSDNFKSSSLSLVTFIHIHITNLLWHSWNVDDDASDYKMFFITLPAQQWLGRVVLFVIQQKSNNYMTRKTQISLLFFRSVIVKCFPLL